MALTVAKELAVHGKRKEAMGIVAQFSNTKNKVMGYSKLAAFTKMNSLEGESKIYLDSALASMDRVKFFRANFGNLGFDYRTGLVEMLTLMDDGSSRTKASEHISSMEFASKVSGVLARVRTYGRMGQYFDASVSIPELANPEDQLRCIMALLYVEVLKRAGDTETEWSKFDKDLLEWVNFTEFLYDLFEY